MKEEKNHAVDQENRSIVQKRKEGHPSESRFDAPAHRENDGQAEEIGDASFDDKRLILDRIAELVEEKRLDPYAERVIRLRYGLERAEPLSFAGMCRVLGVKPKKLKADIERIDRLLFNGLKKQF